MMKSCLLLLFFISASCQYPDNPLLVSTTSGIVQGFYQDDLRVFLGVPYGVIPERFTQSVPHTGSSLINATNYGPACMSFPLFLPLGSPNPRYGQTFITPPSENCLNLNIWGPKQDSMNKLPVYVWVHGGAHQFGSNQDSPVFALARENIVIAINYRLGIFGYAYANNTDVFPNAGVFDVSLALEWIRDNIKEFGGHKKKIHLVGQSAGAANVLFMNLLYGSIEPYSGDGAPYTSVEVRSAGPMLYPVPATSELLTLQVGNVAECSGSSQQVIDCLRQLDANTLLLVSAGNFFFPTIGPGSQFTESFIKAVVNENVDDDIPLMTGYTTHEGTFFIDLSFGLKPENISTEASFDFWATNWILLQNVPFSFVGPALELYKNLSIINDWTLYETLIELTTDYNFRCGARILAESFSNIGGNTYLYEYTHPFDNPVEEQLLDAHAFDLYPYYEGFQLTGVINPAFFNLTEREIAMGRQMQEWAGSMAKHGKPTKGVPKSEKWPKFKTTGNKNVNRIQEVRPLLSGETYGDLVFTNGKTVQCQFWDTVLKSELVF